MNYEKLKEQLEEEYPGNIFQIITVGDLFINDIKNSVIIIKSLDDRVKYIYTHKKDFNQNELKQFYLSKVLKIQEDLTSLNAQKQRLYDSMN